MTYEEFIELGEGEQLGLITECQPISIREDDQFHVLLHNMQDFFVEVFFDKNERSVTKIKASESLESLDSYWQQVNLKELNNLLR